MNHITYGYLNFIYLAWNYDHFWNILFIKHAYTLLLLISINLFIHVFLKKNQFYEIHYWLSLTKFHTKTTGKMTYIWTYTWLYEIKLQKHLFLTLRFQETFQNRNWSKKKISHLIIFTVKLCENKVLGIDDLLFYISNFFFILIRNYFNIIRLGVHV